MSAVTRETIKTTKLSADQIDKLDQMVKAIPTLLDQTDNPRYDEIFGYRINLDSEPHVDIWARNEILLKFLIANDYDVEKTKDKIVGTLNWRNKFQPLLAAYEETFDDTLNDLGVITSFPDAEPNCKYVTWNLYGKIKDPKKIFKKYGGDSSSSPTNPGSQFLRWRVGLMERALQNLDFTNSVNHKIAQVHDYKDVSMFRMDPEMKKSSTEIITIFGENYPELLTIKFFINVPVFMAWCFTFFKKLGFVSAETLKKFQVFNKGDLSQWFGKDNLPLDYNGGQKTNIKLLYSLAEPQSPNSDIPNYSRIILENARLADITENNISVE